MKKISLMLAVLFLFSGLSYAKGSGNSNNNYGRATKTNYHGANKTSTNWSNSGPTSITKEEYIQYKDGSSKHVYTRGNGTKQTINHKK